MRACALGAGAHAADAAFAEQRLRLRECVGAVVERVVIGERDEVDPGGDERVRGDGGRPEGVPLRLWRAARGDGGFEVREGDVGPREYLAHLGEGGIGAVRLETGADATRQHHVSDRREQHGAGGRSRVGGRGRRQGVAEAVALSCGGAEVAAASGGVEVGAVVGEVRGTICSMVSEEPPRQALKRRSPARSAGRTWARLERRPSWRPASSRIK